MNKMEDWISTDYELPDEGRGVELLDAKGNVATGWLDGKLWRFNYWGSGEPIEYWRYVNE